MLAVSNTSPISNLAFIGRLDLLKLQFETLWIPPEVERELALHPDPDALAAIQDALNSQWIRTAPVSNLHLVSLLSLQLHRGEAEAISLASEMKANVVLIDEQEGRQLASALGLSVTGVLGVLLKAKRMGQIPNLKTEIDSLRTKANFFIGSSLEANILSAAGES